MTELSAAFGTIYPQKTNPKVRMNPRPDSSKDLSDLFKQPSNYMMIQNKNRLGALRTDDMQNIDNRNLTYQPRRVDNYKISPRPTFIQRPRASDPQKQVVVCNNYPMTRKPMRDVKMDKMEDWILIAIVIVAVGLFLRWKDHLL